MAMTSKARNVLFILTGIAALVLKRHYSGPFAATVHSFGGNVSASFAVYFVIRIVTSGWRCGRSATTGIAFLVVELFEATDGFGVMTNVYDPADFAANAVGVGLALTLDTLTRSRVNETDPPRPDPEKRARGGLTHSIDC
ncbi:hypothetical protein JXA40_07910 [bacterium]|nr:hypothetical protein [candidate division CSSED10-310 bacterium]